MKQIEKLKVYSSLTYLSVEKANELIDVINSQQRQIERLQKKQGELNTRTSGLQRVGGIIR